MFSNLSPQIRETPLDGSPGSGPSDERRAFQGELAHLAWLAGVWRDYTDPCGNKVPVPEESIQYGLKALGYPAGNLDEIRASTWSLMEKRAQKRVPGPVVVTDEEIAGGELLVSLVLRKGDTWTRTALTATITTEDGQQVSAGAAPSDFRQTGTETLGERRWDYFEVKFKLQDALPYGYHSLSIDTVEAGSDTAREEMLAVAPQLGYIPPELRRAWGLQAQLTGLRSSASHYWAVGNFENLRELVEVAASMGARIVAVSPVHAMGPDRRDVSRYSPDDRGRIDPIHIAVELVPEYLKCTEARERVESEKFQESLEKLRTDLPMDYPEIWKLMDEILRLCHAELLKSANDDSTRLQEFSRFVKEQGPDLFSFAVHRVLNTWFRAQNPPVYSWQNWPEEFRHPEGAAVAKFASEHAKEVSYQMYLQWIAHEQFTGVCRYADSLNVNIFEDMALSTPADSAESWICQSSLILGTSIGAPPEPNIPDGQNWGGTPVHPEKLRELRYQPFIIPLRENMHGGMLRDDHAARRNRLYIIPPGVDTSKGVYISYPLDDLMKIANLESHRNRCMVVCEDLGTISDAFRQAMEKYGATGYEIWHNAPEKIFAEYRHNVVVTGTNHDTPPMDSFWMGADLVFRAAAGEMSIEELGRELGERDKNLAERINYLRRNGIGIPELNDRKLLEEVVVGIYTGLAESPAFNVIVSLQDQDENYFLENVPGRSARFDPTNGYPLLFNRRTLSVEDIRSNPRLARISQAMRRAGRSLS